MELERQEYKGHSIELRTQEAAELRAGEAEPVLLIDDEPMPYGQLPGGLYFLHQYAYDWRDNLADLAKEFIDYRDRADTIAAEFGEET